jgi:SAM-dependent methyltransferase
VAAISRIPVDGLPLTAVCGVCGDRAASERILDIAGTDTGESFAVVRCARCGAMRTAPVPDDLRPYYTTDLAATMTRPGSRLFAALKMLQLGREVQRLQPHVAGRTLLDIGCGTGDFALAAMRRGCDVVAADGSASPPEGLTSHPEISYRRFDFESFTIHDPRPGGPYVAILRHVLEHVRDPARMLARLKEQGVTTFYIVVPNAGSRERRLLGRFWYSWDPPRHLWHFDDDSLRRVCERAGLLSVERGTGTAATLVPSLYRYLRLSGWPAAAYEIFGPNTLFTALSAPLNLALRHNVLWCIARAA